MRLAASLCLGAALCIATIAIGAVASITAAEAAEPFGADPIYDSPLFNFEGFYVGGQVGGAYFATPGLMGTVGVVAGANFALNDGILASLEFQSDLYINGTGVPSFDALLLAHVGGYVMDNGVLYGALGAGTANGAPVYALGGGFEMAVTDQLSARGEALLMGPFVGLPHGGKVSAALLWHLN